MINTLLHLLRLFPFLCGGHRQLALENLALRQQLTVYKRTASRPKLRRSERLFWVCLSRVWAGWRTALVIVAPDTVLRWQRRRLSRPVGERGIYFPCRVGAQTPGFIERCGLPAPRGEAALRRPAGVPARKGDRPVVPCGCSVMWRRVPTLNYSPSSGAPWTSRG
jgi:hypothetical protein